MFLIRDVATAAHATIAGSGIPLGGGITSQRHAVPGGELVWTLANESADEQGSHRFYRQHLVLANGEAVELIGGEVGVHARPSGEVYFVGGAQFTDAVLTNRPRIGRPGLAMRARAAVRSEIPLNERESIVSMESFQRDRDAALTLVSDGSGQRFRYIWQTSVTDDLGRPVSVELDADSGELVSINPAWAEANCSQSTPVQMNQAIGVPIRDDVRDTGLRRQIRANTASRAGGFPYEAYTLGDGASYPATITRQVTDNDTFKCITTNNPSNTVFPVPASLIYDDSGEWKGRVAGDAQFKTMKTMRALYLRGYYSYNNRGSVASIVTESRGYVDNAAWVETATNEFPANTLVIGAVANLRYSMAAALDVVAHEWGHGVLIAGRGISYQNGSEETRQIHEGFADVFGDIVERSSEAAGTGAERSGDWRIGEDTGNGTYFRSASEDDGTTGHLALTNCTMNDSFHPQDPGSTCNGYTPDPHIQGNWLHVVLKMMSDGGNNPICPRTGLGCFFVSGIGYDKASQILWKEFTTYLPATSMQWSELPKYAVLTAFQLYQTCATNGNPAAAEQHAAADAFANINYWPTQLNGCQ